MKVLRGLFVSIHVVGLIAIVVLFLYVEWRFIHGNLSNALNPLVQLFVVGSVFILPPFWLLVCVTVAGYAGKRIIKKKIARSPLEE